MIRSLLLLSLPLFVSAQEPIGKAVHFVPHTGLSWQSTFMWSGSPEPNNSTVHKMPAFPYSSEKGTQGFGIDAGGSVLLKTGKRFQSGFQVNARSRYDYFHQKNEGGEAKTYYLDLSGALLLSYRNEKGRDWIAEGGVTANQLGKKYYFESASRGNKTIDFGYRSYFMGGGYDVAQLTPKTFLHLGAALNYIPKDHPGQPRFQWLNVLLKASVRFR